MRVYEVVLFACKDFSYPRNTHTYICVYYYSHHKHLQYHFHLLRQVIDLLSATRMNIISIADDVEHFDFGHANICLCLFDF